MIGKRFLCAVALVVVTATGWAQDRSLGDVARQQRTAKKQAKRVITNDDVAPAGPAANAGAAPQSQNSTKANGEGKDGAEVYAKKQQDFRGRYAAQKQQLEKLQSEVAALERERQQRVAGYYGDAGNRLRDEKSWGDKQRKLERDIADKQQQVDKAKQALDDIKEQARRAGVPERILED